MKDSQEFFDEHFQEIKPKNYSQKYLSADFFRRLFFLLKYLDFVLKMLLFFRILSFFQIFFHRRLKNFLFSPQKLFYIEFNFERQDSHFQLIV